MKKVPVMMIVMVTVIGLFAVIGSADHQGCPPFAEESEFRIVEKKGHWVKFIPCNPFQREYRWYFGDGSRYSTFFDEAVTHWYEREGVYQVTLVTENLFGEEFITRRRVRIGMPPQTEVRVSVRAEFDELPPEVFFFGVVPLLFLLLSSGS